MGWRRAAAPNLPVRCAAPQLVLPLPEGRMGQFYLTLVHSAEIHLASSPVHCCWAYQMPGLHQSELG